MALDSEVLRLGEVNVCAQCKPAYVQRLQQGDSPAHSLFRDLSRLTAWLRGLLLAGVVLTALALIPAILEFLRLQRERTPSNPEALTGVDLAMIGVGLLQVIVFLATAVLFLRWIYLAKANVHALGATNLRFSPGWSVGWYFIPIAHLWKPYQAMKELWQASHDPAAWASVRPPALLAGWWTLWISSNIIGQASFRSAFAGNTVAVETVSALLTIANCLIDLPLGLVAIALTQRIWKAQAHTRAQPAG